MSATETVDGDWRYLARQAIEAVGQARAVYQARHGQAPTHVGVPAAWREDLLDPEELHGMTVVWLADRTRVLCWRTATAGGGNGDE